MVNGMNGMNDMNGLNGIMNPLQVIPNNGVMVNNGISNQMNAQFTTFPNFDVGQIFYTPPPIPTKEVTKVVKSNPKTKRKVKKEEKVAAQQFPNSSNFQIKIQKQPPPQTVYQRILKPYPVVMLLCPAHLQEQTHNLFIECQLLNDKNIELPLCLDGTKTVRISPGVFATFKKLKISSTSQQQRTLFRLRLQLKRYVGNVFETIDGISIVSNPIEVFSHSYYLNGNIKNKTLPPKINEILPNCGPVEGGLRIVIIGSNFINTGNLLVKFGEMNIPPEYHESGTLIFTLPQGQRGTSVKISVSNDGEEFSQSESIFTYI